MFVIAIDPGNTMSAYVIADEKTLEPRYFGKVPNEELLDIISEIQGFDSGAMEAAIEMVASYGMAVGREVFETCVWIGRFTEALKREGVPVNYVLRMDEKLAICHKTTANDSNIRMALIDMFAKFDFKNGKGTKKNRDFFYGFSKDMWAAFAVAYTFKKRKDAIREREKNNV